MYLGDQKIPINLLQVRNKARGQEAPLETYGHFQMPRQVDEGALKLLNGLNTHKYEESVALAPLVLYNTCMEICTGKYSIKHIFQHNNNWDKFKSQHAAFIRPAVHYNLERVFLCKTDNLGFYHYLCPKCGNTKKSLLPANPISVLPAAKSPLLTGFRQASLNSLLANRVKSELCNLALYLLNKEFLPQRNIFLPKTVLTQLPVLIAILSCCLLAQFIHK